MPRPAVLVALAVPAAAALAGCSFYVDLGQERGPEQTQERDVTAVAGVELKTTGSLTLAVGEPSLTVTAGERVLDDLVTEIRGDALVIDLPSRWHDAGDIHYELTMPALSVVELSGSGEITGDIAGTGSDELSVGGSGRIEVDHVTADGLTVSVDGSGEVLVGDVSASRTTVTIGGSGRAVLSGDTDELSVAIPGSGEVDVADLVAQDAVVEVDGSGDVAVNVVRTLDAAVAGSGTVTYAGDPDVRQSVTGSGSVSSR